MGEIRRRLRRIGRQTIVSGPDVALGTRMQREPPPARVLDSDRTVLAELAPGEEYVCEAPPPCPEPQPSCPDDVGAPYWMARVMAGESCRIQPSGQSIVWTNGYCDSVYVGVVPRSADDLWAICQEGITWQWSYSGGDPAWHGISIAIGASVLIVHVGQGPFSQQTLQATAYCGGTPIGDLTLSFQPQF